MLTLEYLQEKGFISDQVKKRSTEDIKLTKASEFNPQIGEDYKDALVVADDFRWVASEMPLGRTPGNVYSSDGEYLYHWKRSEQKLIKKSLVGEVLGVTEVLENKKEKEIRTMSKEKENLGNFDLGDLGGGMGDMNLFGDGAAPVTATVDDAVSGSIVPKIDRESSNMKFFMTAKEEGRFHAFITRTPAAVKVGKSKVKMLGSDGKPILSAAATPEAVKDYNEGKNVAAKYLEQETRLVFREAKPGAIVGGIISYPAGLQSNATFINDILAGKEVKFDEKNKDRLVKVLPSEQLYATIATMFHGQIKEDEKIMGTQASWLQIYSKKVNTNKNSKKNEAAGATVADPSGQQQKFRPCLILNKDSQKRKSMLVEGNYIPMSLYKTASQQNLTQELADGLNLNLESLVRTADAYEALSSISKEDVKWQDEGDIHVTSEYFKADGQCKPITVTRYFDKQQTMTDVRIPLKERRTNKKGGQTYSFITYKLDDEANGPLSDARYLEILRQAGLTKESFKEQAKKLARRNNGGKKNDDTNSIEDYLSAIQGTISERNKYEGVLDSSALVKALKGIA